MGLAYGIEGADDDDAPLRDRIQRDRDQETGARRHTPRSGLALMVFFVFACQCISTLAVVRRETRSWRWPIVMFVSMTALAYLMALLTYQVGGLLGFE
jgi:ferrous iron transport protein B